MSDNQQAVRFSAGNVIANSFSVLFGNFVPFMLLALLVNSLVLLPLLLDTQPLPDPATDVQIDTIGAILGVFNWLLVYVLTAALTYGTVQHLRGRKVGFGDCLQQGAVRFMPAALAGIVVGLLVGLASLLFVIPGIIVWVMLWVVIPVVVIERPGIGASLKRSAELTKGHRWGVFGIFFLLSVGMIIVIAIAGGVVFALPLDAVVPVSVVLDWVLSSFLTALFAVMVAVTYYTLRSEKDGVDIEEIAAVFD